MLGKIPPLLSNNELCHFVAKVFTLETNYCSSLPQKFELIPSFKSPNVIPMSCRINTKYPGHLKWKTAPDKCKRNVQNLNDVVKPLGKNDKEVAVTVTFSYLFLASVSFSGWPFLRRKLIKKVEVNVWISCAILYNKEHCAFIRNWVWQPNS